MFTTASDDKYHHSYAFLTSGTKQNGRNSGERFYLVLTRSWSSEEIIRGKLKAISLDRDKVNE